MAILLNVAELEKLQREYQLTDTVLIKKIGIHRSQFYRAKKGAPIGEKFIEGVLAVFPLAKYEQLFFMDFPGRVANQDEDKDGWGY